MQKLGLNELRKRFLDFFEGKGHLILPSFPLVPHNDPSILLINAGMTPLKPYFTGQETPPRNRIATCQKCIRTPDIENVGKTARHGTFFEMLGNFSFGDYFKKEAIRWAWEFVTVEMGMPKDKLWVTIYQDDDEAFEIWNKDIGISFEYIVRMGKESNFWEHGVGPCGPCSEIYFDRGPDKGCGSPDCKVGCECDRYIEFWNLVFTQFNKDEQGNYTKLEKKNIDTGMGLERIACIMQDVDNLFEVDTIRKILDYVCRVAGVQYGKDDKTDVSIRVITDHIRSTVMMVADGIIPSNEGRGYVLRRLLRRAARHGKLLGIDKEFLYKVADVVIEESMEAYPELKDKTEYITKVIRVEEERFEATINQGLAILNEYISEAKAKNESVIQGSAVFKLHDTFGFPLDLTREIAEENQLTVDEEGFRAEMEEQKRKAREALKDKESSAWGQSVYASLDKGRPTEFVGYDKNQCCAQILYIIKDGSTADVAETGDNVVIMLDRTPFYAESGGQVGDSGTIQSQKVNINISDCKKTPNGNHLHIGIVKKGSVQVGDEIEAKIDVRRRLAAARNHTATHLLHKALRNVLGGHIDQAGSLVSPERLRFDFTHFSSISEEEIKRIESEVNDKIMESIPVEVEEVSLEEAKKRGATALFGEKYGDVVRVVKVGDYSMELCGGTHLSSTSQAGLIKILGENGIAAGVRRIEALTGEGALEYYHKQEDLLNQVSSILKTNPEDMLKKVEGMIENFKKADTEIEQLRNKLINSSMDDILSNVINIENLKVISASIDNLDMEALRETGDKIRNKLGSGIVVLASRLEDKVNFVIMATKDAVGKGIHSGKIIREVAKIAGGGGGGRPDMAQAGGKDTSKVDEALGHAIKVVQQQIAKNID